MQQKKAWGNPRFHKMEHKLCLILNNYPLGQTDGGPSGCLARNLLGHSSSCYKLGTVHTQDSKSMLERLWKRIINHRSRQLTTIGLHSNSSFADWLLQGRRNYVAEHARRYDWIWFHDVMTLRACLNLIPASQHVILQSHCPQLPSEEESAKGTIGVRDIEWVKKAERLAFARANITVFPNEHARAIYDPLLPRTARIEYITSGCSQMNSRFIPPLDAQYTYYFYVGRRNRIKGFDVVLGAFQKAYTMDSSLRLVIAGSGDPIRHPGVLDLGYSTELAGWLEACDYFLSINRQSYFDLSVMEALSLGTPLIIACTNGHTEFANLRLPGIIPLSAADSHLLIHAMLGNRRKRSQNMEAVTANKKLFRERFSDNQYRSRLEYFLANLTKEYK